MNKSRITVVGAEPAVRKRDAQQSRERLLAAGIEVFAAKGRHAATVEEICRVAGLNKRLIYHYYGSKDRLYQEALRYVYEQFFSLEVTLGSMLLPAEELLATLVRRYYEFLRDHRSFVRLICYENLDDGRTASQLKLHGQKAPVITALRLALKKGETEKRFRHDIDVTQLLISIFALCFFYFSNQHTMNQFLGSAPLTKAALDRRIDHVVHLLLHGIAHQNLTADP